MNIFVLDKKPEIAARMHCDKHIPKMCVEAAQMMASALRRHGATDEQMPLTKSGTPYKGGYAHHPCTVWAGENRKNFIWLYRYGITLCQEYTSRFGKVHSCSEPMQVMYRIRKIIPPRKGKKVPFAQAMPDEYKDEDAVKAYRAYYHSKQFAKWEKGTPAPNWWQGVEVTT